jgi:DNA-binding winged helix-turn-helix (wHTH) protein
MGVSELSADLPAGTFRFGEFTFDCGSRQLTGSGEPRHLSPKAQQLLQALLLARPRALSREELYDALWPSTFVCETNLATVVNELRRALGDDPRSAQYVRTVHGFGYAFCGEVSSSPGGVSHAGTLVCDGQSHLLCEGTNIVGRSPDSRVVLADPMISRQHALITIDDGTIRIKDLDSKNGTFVDGKRVGSSPVLVTPQSQVTIALTAVLIVPRKNSTASLRMNLPEIQREVAVPFP